MVVFYKIKGSLEMKIKTEEFNQMLKEGINIENINEVDTWIRKNKDIEINKFNTDVSDEEISGYLLEENEEDILKDILKNLKDEKEKNSPFENQLTLFGGVVGV